VKDQASFSLGWVGHSHLYVQVFPQGDINLQDKESLNKPKGFFKVVFWNLDSRLSQKRIYEAFNVAVKDFLNGASDFPFLQWIFAWGLKYLYTRATLEGRFEHFEN
jgi:hypothetical protein